MKRVLAVLMMFIAVPAVAQEVEVGDTVLAHWAPTNAYFVGTAVEERDASFLIVFEDGDTAVVSKLQVIKNDLTVGSRVHARWSDNRYYPGIVPGSSGVRSTFIMTTATRGGYPGQE